MDQFQKTIGELTLGPDISIIRIIDELIFFAEKKNSSDIHIIPNEINLRVRFRIDGILNDICILPKEIHLEIISRIKILAGLRTDDHNSAQDGRFRSILEEGKSIDMRVSIMPTYYGENAVIRLLSENAENFTLETLGFCTDDQKKIKQAIQKPSGMILVTGPTGSGKTTTLYTLIKTLNSKEISIVTIEDPIEYSIKNIQQIQINPRTELTFAKGLRSILRQDPDIIMVGEIRDIETANIAINTALTGHLLLSTLHTNDAATILPRLLDMKIEAFLVASTISLVIGQRLVRKICSNCRISKPLNEEEYLNLSLLVPLRTLEDNKTFYYGSGCKECGGSGYRGRLVINEVLVPNQEIRNAILLRASAYELKQIAIKNGMTTMLEDGIKKAILGLTSLAEVLRATSD